MASAITVRISGRAVSSADEPADVLEAIAEDVTDRRVLEDQFRQAQKMEAVGRLAGGVAHDFNNLLMVISGYAEVILASSTSTIRCTRRRRAIQQAADRATTLTRQLLAFSRKQLLELKVVDVNAIVQDMERLLRPLIGENVEFITRLTPDAAHTRADAGQLEQVLMNLVVNAKDAMPGGGKLTIQTENLVVDENHRRGQTFIRPGHYVMLSVSDTGIGMDKETQSRIFEPFFTTKEKGKGTGLGLSTVYGIVKQSGGYVMVQSEEGVGTTFHIYLPRVEGVAEQHAAPVAHAALGGTETVLLVEDEESGPRTGARHAVRQRLPGPGSRKWRGRPGRCRTPRRATSTSSSPTWSCLEWAAANWSSNLSRPVPKPKSSISPDIPRMRLSATAPSRRAPRSCRSLSPCRICRARSEKCWASPSWSIL